MKLVLNRIKTTDDSTLGYLTIDGAAETFTLEDAVHVPKVYGETRIPAGNYEIKLRTSGGMHARYSEKFDFHRGMLWLQDVPNFKWVYIHIGNTEDDTDGCVLVGNKGDLSKNQHIEGSALAYKRIYTKIADAIINNELTVITVR